jgi:DNA polymerase III delta prime subunit
MTINEFVRDFLDRHPRASNDEVAAAVKRAVPGANTTAQSVASIKSRLKTDTRESLPWVGEVEGDAEETEDEARARISLRYSAMERMAVRLAMGQMPSLIISGPPGLGKSYTMRAALKMVEDDADKDGRVVRWIGGAASAVGVYKALWDCHNGGVIVLDDCDDVFRDETSLNLLKVALDSSPERLITWAREAPWMGEEIPDTFDFQGHVCFITNVDFEAAIDTGRRDAEHFKALIDRSMYLCLTLRTRRDFMIRIRDVAAGPSGMLVQHFGLTAEQSDEVVQFVEDNKERFYNLSLRLCGQIAICMKADPDGWREDVEATKMRTL